MKKLKTQWIAAIVAAVTLASFIVPATYSVVSAEETVKNQAQTVNSPSEMPGSIDTTSEDELLEKEIEALLLSAAFQEKLHDFPLPTKEEEKYVELDFELLEKNAFDEKKMAEKQKELFDQLLEDEVTKNLHDEKKQVIQELKTLLKETGNENTLPLKSRYLRIGTVKQVAAVINVIITGTTLIASGGSVASIVGLVKKKGLKWATNWIKNTLIGKIKNRLLNFGVRVALLGGLSQLINSLITLDPGLFIAKWLDSIDSKKNNGFLEVG